MTVTSLFLYLLLVLAVAGGIGMVALRNPIHAAVSLLTTMLSLAGTYALLSAHLMAVFQVIIYAGAIMVLVVYIIMLLDVGGDDADAFRNPMVTLLLPALATAVGFAIALVIIAGKGGSPQSRQGILASFGDPQAVKITGEFGTVRSIGEDLLTTWILPFEATSILLLAGIVGAIYLTGKDSAGLRALGRRDSPVEGSDQSAGGKGKEAPTHPEVAA